MSATTLSYVPGESLFHKLDPRVKMWLFIVNIICVLTLISEPISICILTLLLYAYSCRILPRNKVNFLLKPLAPLIGFLSILWVGLSIPATNAAKDPKNVIMYLIPNINFFPITVEGIVYAISMGARFFEILIVILLIIMTTSVKDLVLPFMKYKRLVKFAIAASLSLTFIPALTRIVQQVLDAQKIRGWKGMESRNVVERIKSFIAIFIPVMVMSMDYATKIALALESRALDYDVAKRTLTRKLKYSKRDYAMFSFLVICILISLYLSEYVSGYGTYITTVRLIKKYFMQKAWP